MTVGQILENAAAMLNISTTDMVVGGAHLGIRAMNNARKKAEQVVEFVYPESTVRLSVSPTAGGNLSSAVLESDGTTAVSVKTVHMAYLRDATVSPTAYTPLYFDSKLTLANRTREAAERWSPDYEPIWRYRDDNEWLLNSSKLSVYHRGRVIYLNPQQSEAKSLALDCTLWLTDYTQNRMLVSSATEIGGGGITVTLSEAAPANVVAGTAFLGTTITAINGARTTITLLTNSNQTITTPTWVTYTTGPGLGAGNAAEDYTDWFVEQGAEYLQWSVVCELNYRFSKFVNRAEGYIGAPEKLRDQALEALVLWDGYQLQSATTPTGIS